MLFDQRTKLSIHSNIWCELFNQTFITKEYDSIRDENI